MKRTAFKELLGSIDEARKIRAGTRKASRVVKAGIPVTPSFQCFFCGAKLVPEVAADTLRCRTCRAVLTVRRNERGCVTEMAVRDCGAGAECCQQKKMSSNRPPAMGAKAKP